MSLLLEAKKHGRLVSKSQGADEGRWGRGDGDSWRAAPRGGESKSKDKGKAAARRRLVAKRKSGGRIRRTSPAERRRRGPMRPRQRRSEGEE